MLKNSHIYIHKAKAKGVLSVSISEENIPNRTTKKVIEEALKGKNVIECSNFDDYLQKMNTALIR